VNTNKSLPTAKIAIEESLSIPNNRMNKGYPNIPASKLVIKKGVIGLREVNILTKRKPINIIRRIEEEIIPMLIITSLDILIDPIALNRAAGRAMLVIKYLIPSIPCSFIKLYFLLKAPAIITIITGMIVGNVLKIALIISFFTVIS
jgi:hypothetical protein